MTELAAPQITSLMEALPGIAAVLRSPVASALVDLIRAASGLGEFHIEDAEELLRFGVRRNLIDEEEVERLLAEVRAKHPNAVRRSAAAKAPKPTPPKKDAVSTPAAAGAAKPVARGSGPLKVGGPKKAAPPSEPTPKPAPKSAPKPEPKKAAEKPKAVKPAAPKAAKAATPKKVAAKKATPKPAAVKKSAAKPKKAAPKKR